MRIVVCIKQVPDAREVRLDPKTNTLSREGVASIMNPYDRHALEAGVCLKEQHGGEVVAITMGPPQAKAVLEQAVACGADRGVLISDRAFAGADTWATSYVLERAIRHLGGADVILCGKQAIDGDTAQVGPGVATRLDIPFVTCVQKVRESAVDVLVVERMMDDGFDVLKVRLPVLLTVVKDINTPRVPSLKGKMKAKKSSFPVLSAEDIDAESSCIGLPGSPTQVARVFPPQPRKEGAILTGNLDEQIEQLVDGLLPYLEA